MFYVCSIELCPCRGGTKIESWSSTDALDACGIPPNVNENDPQHSSSALWNAMMHPFTRHNVYGGLWYQGKLVYYREENKGLFVLLSTTQAGPGRTVKQEQEDSSRNHVQTFSGCFPAAQ